MEDAARTTTSTRRAEHADTMPECRKADGTDGMKVATSLPATSVPARAATSWRAGHAPRCSHRGSGMRSDAIVTRSRAGSSNTTPDGMRRFMFRGNTDIPIIPACAIASRRRGAMLDVTVCVPSRNFSLATHRVTVYCRYGIIVLEVPHVSIPVESRTARHCVRIVYHTSRSLTD